MGEVFHEEPRPSQIGRAPIGGLKGFEPDVIQGFPLSV